MRILKGLTGVTLLELLIVVVIISIISITAMTMYSSYARRGRRIDGINIINSISLAEERYRSNNSQYGTLAQVWGGVTTSPEGYYTLAISNISSTSYTISATAVGDQVNDAANGTVCTPLVLAVSNGVVTKTPNACWPV